jgi:hypothetical protein
MHRRLKLLIERQIGIPVKNEGSRRICGADGRTATSGARGVLQISKNIARPGRPGEIVVLGALINNVIWM